MAGFNYDSGCSNNMLEARERGMMNIGAWGRRYRVSAAAVENVMCPTEAHHTGTGRRGTSRLTYVISTKLEPTADQVAEMKRYDSPAGKQERADLAAKLEAERAAAVKFEINQYGNLDIRGGIPAGYEHIRDQFVPYGTTRSKMNQAGIKFAAAMTGFLKCGRHYIPAMDGIVVEIGWREKLAALPPAAPAVPAAPAAQVAAASAPMPAWPGKAVMKKLVDRAYRSADPIAGEIAAIYKAARDGGDLGQFATA